MKGPHPLVEGLVSTHREWKSFHVGDLSAKEIGYDDTSYDYDCSRGLERCKTKIAVHSVGAG